MYYFFSSTFVYYLSLVAVIVLLPLLIIALFRAQDFLGFTLSQWITRAQQRSDEVTAKKLQEIRKLLETLAHDVLKHRLLGLISLVRSLDSGDGTPKSLDPEAYDDFLEEIFRLCGTKAAPHERLWTRWVDTFVEIKAIAGRSLLKPIADPMLNSTARLMQRLQSMFKLYVAKDLASAVTPQALLKLNIENSAHIHQSVLSLASGCRMRINPREIVESAISALSLQMGRKSPEEKIEVVCSLEGEFLADAPMRLLIMSVARLLDNALAQGSGKARVVVERNQDEFSEEGFLTIRVLDTSSQIPEPSKFGEGLRGMSRSLMDFSCGFTYREVKDEEFRKEALITMQICEAEALPVLHFSTHRYFAFGAVYLLFFAIFLQALFRIFGGAPIRFAGSGDTIIEFPVNVGQTLSIPLCEGGSAPRVELSIASGACWKDRCSLDNVLESLRPCEKSLKHPSCPRKLEWTPVFEDGSRQGKRYELRVRCYSPGPPVSEDVKNIRILVTRPNSVPELLLLQLQDIDTMETKNINPNAISAISADSNLRLRVLAIDKDSDLLLFRLKLPNGQTLESYDGQFILPLEWSQFGTWTSVLEITDQVSPPISVGVRLKADRLRPIELRNLGVWSQRAASSLSCVGSGESRLCDLTDGEVNELNVQLWFDPLLERIEEKINFSTSPDSPIVVAPLPNPANRNLRTNSIGDRWELRERSSQQTLAVIELANLFPYQRRGLKEFGFRITVAPLSPLDPLHWPVIFQVSESSQRAAPLQTLLIFSRQGLAKKSIVMSNKHISLQEYDKDSDANTGAANIQLLRFSNQSSKRAPSLKPIVCENDFLSSHFQDPELVSLSENTWSLAVKLKQGCIAGLSEKLSEKERMCFLEIVFDDRTNESDFLWISLKDRVCAPRIEKLELVSTTEELMQNYFNWNFIISDTDSILSAQDIRVSGVSGLEVNVNESEKTFGQRFSGSIAGRLKCSSAPKNINLEIGDQSKSVIKKSLQTNLYCPPLVSTKEKQAQFHVDEGEVLSVELVYEKDVKLKLEDGIGALEQSHFVWKASCVYGRGPHKVKIHGTSAKQYAQPLEFEVVVDKCIPRLILESNTTTVASNETLTIGLNSSQNLEVRILKAEEPFQLNTSFVHSNADMRIERENSQALSFAVICGDTPSKNTLQIQALPQEEDTQYLASQVLQIQIECTRIIEEVKL